MRDSSTPSIQQETRGIYFGYYTSSKQLWWIYDKEHSSCPGVLLWNKCVLRYVLLMGFLIHDLSPIGTPVTEMPLLKKPFLPASWLSCFYSRTGKVEVWNITCFSDHLVASISWFGSVRSYFYTLKIWITALKCTQFSSDSFEVFWKHSFDVTQFRFQ